MLCSYGEISIKIYAGVVKEKVSAGRYDGQSMPIVTKQQLLHATIDIAHLFCYNIFAIGIWMRKSSAWGNCYDQVQNFLAPGYTQAGYQIKSPAVQSVPESHGAHDCQSKRKASAASQNRHPKGYKRFGDHLLLLRLYVYRDRDHRSGQPRRSIGNIK